MTDAYTSFELLLSLAKKWCASIDVIAIKPFGLILSSINLLLVSKNVLLFLCILFFLASRNQAARQKKEQSRPLVYVGVFDAGEDDLQAASIFIFVM